MAESEPTLDVERAVRERYQAAARAREPSLCCPVRYDRRLLGAIPHEVLERDYGCGDPSPWVRPGDVVLDLGCGGGKLCFIACQLAGPEGQVIGIDVNREMLALARRAAPQVTRRLGYANVGFRRGRIQDLALDLDRLESWLAEHPVRDAEGLSALEAEMDRLRRRHPLVSDGSVDLVVSNCVLNLVRPPDKQRLFHEIHRVLRPGGRIAISDIVSDAPAPPELCEDPELWSGCVSGAFEEPALLGAISAAGFSEVQVAERGAEPFRIVAGIRFQSLTVTARRGGSGDGGERRRAAPCC